MFRIERVAYYGEHVMSDKSESVMSSRQAAELDHAFERNGWTPADVKKLSSGDVLKKVRQVVLGAASIQVTKHLIDLTADPFIPEGWAVEEHQKPAGKKNSFFAWDASRVKFHLDPGQKDGKTINGNTLRTKLGGQQVLNANVLDYLFAHPELVPEEWKDKAIFFWGTIYRNSGGNLYVRCLYWGVSRWVWVSVWLGDGWGGDNPALVRAK